MSEQPITQLSQPAAPDSAPAQASIPKIESFDQTYEAARLEMAQGILDLFKERFGEEAIGPEMRAGIKRMVDAASKQPDNLSKLQALKKRWDKDLDAARRLRENTLAMVVQELNDAGLPDYAAYFIASRSNRIDEFAAAALDQHKQ